MRKMFKGIHLPCWQYASGAHLVFLSPNQEEDRVILLLGSPLFMVLQVALKFFIVNSRFTFS